MTYPYITKCRPLLALYVDIPNSGRLLGCGRDESNRSQIVVGRRPALPATGYFIFVFCDIFCAIKGVCSFVAGFLLFRSAKRLSA
jgi:hypothetical protein